MAAPRIWDAITPPNLRNLQIRRDEFAICRPCIPPVDSDKICVCGIKY